MTIEATSSRGAIVHYRGITVAGATSVTYSKPDGTMFKLGTTLVQITANGASGLAQGSFKVHVVDTTAPAIKGTGDVTAEATSAGGATVNYSAPTANDFVSGKITPKCSPASNGTFPLGRTTITCTATDHAGNKSTSSFAVNVVDTTPPRFALPSNVSASAANASGTVVTYATPVATDLVTASPTVSCSPASGSTFAIGSTSVGCTATDAAGNKVTTTFLVVVTKLIAAPGFYSGTTSQGNSITFRVTTDNQVTDLGIDYTTDCTSSAGGAYTIDWTLSSGSGNIKSDGSIAVEEPTTVTGTTSGTSTIYLSGHFDASTASGTGTFVATAQVAYDGATYTCSTPQTSWTVHRSG